MSANPAMTDYYARRATEYDRVYQKPERQADLAVLRERVAALLADRSVYELACGTGYWTDIYAPGARRVFATDYNEEVLDIARARLAGRGAVTLARADAFAPPAAPMGCDGGFAGFWWSHLRHAETSAFVSAWFARLQPGARVLIIDNRYVAGSSTPIARRDEEGNSYQLRRLADGSEHEVLKNFPDETRVRAALGARSRTFGWTELEYYWLAEIEVA